MFIQLQDVTFSEGRINVPKYLLEDPIYGGGAARQYNIPNDDEEKARPGGWMARRWDPAVQERLYKLFSALGKEFDGLVEGVNLAETSFTVGRSGKLFPGGFSFEIYRDAVISNMRALKAAFPRSVVLIYANFMPGEWRSGDDKGYLKSVFDAAERSHIGVGGPDLLPFWPGQMEK